MALLKHDHTQHTTHNPERALNFYTKVLGVNILKEYKESGKIWWDVDLGGIPLRISDSTGADDALKGLRVGLHHISLAVDNMDQYAADLKSKGVEFIVEPTLVRPEIKVAFIQAPDDVILELIEIKED